MDNPTLTAAAEALRGQRVAILSHSHHTLSKGGAEIAAQTLFAGLRGLGVDVILIACCAEDARARLELGRGEHALFYDPARYDDFYHLAGSDVRRQLLDLLARERITLLNAHHFLYTGIGVFNDVARAGIEIVFTIHEFLAICHNHGQMITRPTALLCERAGPRACHACFPERTRQQFALRQMSFADALSRVGAFVSPSHFLAERFVEWGVPAERMNVAENGVVLRHPPAEPAQAADRRLWTFGFFGQINPFKGLDVILGACAVIARNAELAERIRIRIHGNFVGQGDAFMERFDAALKDYSFLSYNGPYDNAIVGRLMAGCDYVVAPSSWWENSPVVIQEAYQARRPVLCTGIGGMAEKVVDGETGLHFARNDPADLAAKIVEASNPTLFQRLQANLPAVVDPAGMAETYAGFYAAVLAAPINRLAEPAGADPVLAEAPTSGAIPPAAPRPRFGLLRRS